MNSYTNLLSSQTSPPSGVNVNITNPLNQTNPYSNTQLQNLFSNSLLQPRHIVQQVSDEKEIYSIPMGVDSSDFILHSTKPLIYFVATDSSGNKTSIIPFDIQQHVSEPEPTMQDVKAIEEKFENRLNIFKTEISDMISTKLEEALK